MSSTPSNSRTFAANTSLGLKLTPSNSPYQRTPRSPKKVRSLYESGLSLKRIIGNTLTSPTGFDSLSSSRIFAYTAGAAAVVVFLDDDLKYTQRFFRARPAALPFINNNIPQLNAPSTPSNSANESRNRAVAALRENGIGYSPSTPTTTQFDWNDSPKTWTSRERIKAATCLSLSGDGRFLAVGETGYTPRVLIFSVQDSMLCSVLTEHTYGVRAVAYSPDGRYLASLGNVNDGFLYVWAINQKTGGAALHSSNKCTSFIKGMVWMGSCLITVGTRHVKVWRVAEDAASSPSKQQFSADVSTPATPSQITSTRTLIGRNCLLGSLVDSTFTCVASISDRMAVICSERGDVCLLEDDQEGTKLIKAGETGFQTACIAVDFEGRMVRMGGRSGMTANLCFDDLIRPRTPLEPVTTSDSPGGAAVCAMAFVDNVLITVDTHHAISFFQKDASTLVKDTAPLTAHSDAVLGVKLLCLPNKMDAAFYTWSANGKVLFWDLQGHSKGSMQVEVEQSLLSDDESSQNQCQIVRAANCGAFFVTGDKFGMLRVLEGPQHESTFVAKAHASEILGIDIFENEKSTLIATCGRDRTVQLFSKAESTWTLLQTMDEHTASVCSLFFCENGEKLVSCSTDRTISIRQIVTKEVEGNGIVMAAIPVRVINLKASPVSMVLSPTDPSTSFVVSLLDRTVATYEISTGRLITSFRAVDNESTDAVVMDALVMGKPSSLPGRPTILAGVSSTDKSVRIYDGNTGAFLDRQHGHTSSVTDVALDTSEPDRTTVISTGSDGTIMIWDLSAKVPELLEPFESQNDRDQSPPKEMMSAARPPLRRILSRAEISEFQRQSPASTPTGSGRNSPPRQPLRRKTSKYSMSTQSPKLPPPVPAVPANYAKAMGDDSNSRRSPRNRSRSPPASPKSKVTRRPSMQSLDLRGRTKSTGNLSEFGTLNMSTEQVCRTLRAYRKKLNTTETIREEALKELDTELRLTAKALGEKTLKNKAISETVLAGILDQYSERLVSIFDEKLRLSLHPNSGDSGSGEGTSRASSQRRASDRGE